MAAIFLRNSKHSLYWTFMQLFGILRHRNWAFFMVASNIFISSCLFSVLCPRALNNNIHFREMFLSEWLGHNRKLAFKFKMILINLRSVEWGKKIALVTRGLPVVLLLTFSRHFFEVLPQSTERGAKPRWRTILHFSKKRNTLDAEVLTSPLEIFLNTASTIEDKCLLRVRETFYPGSNK